MNCTEPSHLGLYSTKTAILYTTHVQQKHLIEKYHSLLQETIEQNVANICQSVQKKIIHDYSLYFQIS